MSIPVPKTQKVQKNKTRESIISKSVKKAEQINKQRTVNDHVNFLHDQLLNSRLQSAISSSPEKIKKKKPEPIDPSKNFMAKNMEKIAELQKVKEQEKIEKQKDDLDVYSPPKKDADKAKKELVKQQNHQISAKLKFLKVIEDLKSKGKDPVFNLVKDFTING